MEPGRKDVSRGGRRVKKCKEGRVKEELEDDPVVTSGSSGEPRPESPHQGGFVPGMGKWYFPEYK